MNYSVTGAQMKRIDSYTIQGIGIPSLVLMERAALLVAAEIEADAGKQDYIVCVCGGGNNGADGVAVGRILHGRGYHVQIILAGAAQDRTEELQQQIAIAGQMEVPMAAYTDDRTAIANARFIVDALFGIGLSRAVTGIWADLIGSINANSLARVYAVDIPSGIHADTGAVLDTAVQADVTVTFGYIKTGQLLYPGRFHCGKISVGDIGCPPGALARAGYDTLYYDRQDLAGIPDRPPYSNKGTFGKVLIVAGSEGMSGAAYFSALAAYRTGAGLVKILTAGGNREILQTQLPEAVIEVYPADARTDLEGFLEEQCRWATVIVLGPGLGTGEDVETLVSGILTHAYVPIVLDADGLNAVARYPYLTGYFTENIIVTPHVGEMSRLTGKRVSDIAANLLGTARDYARLHGITCVLKDAVTVVAGREGESYLNRSGNSAMAKGGSGDVLTGVIAGLLALGMDEGEAARLGVYIHGLAGEEAARMKGIHGVIAGDLIACIPGRMEVSVNHEAI